MDILIARQPIYDRRLKVYAYELLYRSSTHTNAFIERDGDFATAAVIAGAFLNRGIETVTDNKMGFINFSDAFLAIDFIKALPAKYLGIEILETSAPTFATHSACYDLFKLGYVIALDDYVAGGVVDELLQYAKIIKVDFLTSTEEQISSVIKDNKGKGIKFIAEKIETKEAYEKAKHYGYDYYQGHYFSRPTYITNKLIPPMHINILRVLTLVHDEDCDIKEVAEIIKYDPGMAHKIFRLANSTAFGATQKVKTLEAALVRIGLEELHIWIFMLLTYNMFLDKPNELVRQSILRARVAEEVSKYRNLKDDSGFSLIGLFSLLDAIMDVPFELLLEGIPMPEYMKEALISPGSDVYSTVINLIRSYDNADWQEAEHSCEQIDLSLNEYNEIYLDALTWCDKKCATFVDI